MARLIGRQEIKGGGEEVGVWLAVVVEFLKVFF